MLTAQQIADNLNASKELTGEQFREQSASSNVDFDPSKYGLSVVDASESDYDKGIIKGLNGQYYQIDNFERQQKQGLDTDKGDVFSSSLEEDAGVDYSDFNTVKDVEYAIKDGDWTSSSNTETTDEDYIPSETLAKARAGVNAYESEILPHLGDYFTGKKEDMFSEASDYANSYKLNLAAELEPVNADDSPRPSTIQFEKQAVRGKDRENSENAFA